MKSRDMALNRTYCRRRQCLDYAGTLHFVAWYNGEHRHSGIKFVTPDERHFRRETDILEHRRRVYERARHRHPERWTGSIRDWSPAGPVRLGITLREREIRVGS